ncbi:ATP-binding protein [Aquiflexum gelatinilyticum]|uniref:ATP-binding protein n=1 Tax=Aquiflexum gelatinilyticum TaxID=2961943 RepID=A0A9X2SZT5_9BACT|nr:ATP-binding protein [Aquiflexum gelatinilyticum]MCR9014196.1 ATP-binding protein [Aquiflexum gelatinilyticum]MCS4433671.1 ATP-binding protein [Aquiflexum gelatinilyticum]
MNSQLRLYCDTSQLSELRQFLEEILDETTLSEIEQHQVILAVEEVCANLIIHSHDCNSKEFIDLNVISTQSLVVFEILDFGKGFNILEYQEPEISQVIKSKRKGGLGIMLVKRIMDKIEFESLGNKNICRLFKILKSK